MEATDFHLPVEHHIDHDHDAKYIIFISYGFVTIDLHFHSDIFDEYQQLLRGKSKALRATVLGGGIVTINNSAKTVKTYGTSGGYGSTSLGLLKYVVAETFKGYEQDVTITRYIRG